MKKTTIHAKKKALEAYLPSSDPRLQFHDRWLAETPRDIALNPSSEEDVRSKDFRKRFFRDLDSEAVFEYIAVNGERALQVSWVSATICWWRRILTKQARFQWPPKETSDPGTRKEQADDCVILPHPENRKGGPRPYPPLSGPLSRLFRRKKVYYHWRPIPRGEDARVKKEAVRSLKRVGEMLAFVGGGADKKLTPEEAKQNTTTNNCISQQTRRALRYYQKAWEQYQTETTETMTPETILIKAQHIADQVLARDSPAMNEAREWYWKEVNRDPRLRESYRAKRTTYAHYKTGCDKARR